ncbi:MAG: 3-hydroxyacyl-CoA dehydrogenase family protein [Bacteroidota bacterium]
MKVVVITNEELKKELLAQGLQEDVKVEWQEEIRPAHEADGYIDLLFNHSSERIDKLKDLPAGSGGQPAIIIVNAVNNVLSELPAYFIRINGWNSFLQRPLVEAAGADGAKAGAEKIFTSFNKTTEWVPDIPGFITARVISMIINEAFFTLDEKVSTKEEIDTAMKLGTNYPYGPFEWGSLIGLKKVNALLTSLATINSRYTPSSLLQKEALA